MSSSSQSRPTFVAHVGRAEGRACAPSPSFFALIGNVCGCKSRQRIWKMLAIRVGVSQPFLPATRLPPRFLGGQKCDCSSIWALEGPLAAFIVRSAGSRIAYSSGGVTKDKPGGQGLLIWSGGGRTIKCEMYLVEFEDYLDDSSQRNRFKEKNFDSNVLFRICYVFTDGVTSNTWIIFDFRLLEVCGHAESLLSDSGGLCKNLILEGGHLKWLTNSLNRGHRLNGRLFESTFSHLPLITCMQFLSPSSS